MSERDLEAYEEYMFITCPNCGKDDILYGTRFCSECGIEIPYNDTSEEKYYNNDIIASPCPYCGRLGTEYGAKKCNFCGADISYGEPWVLRLIFGVVFCVWGINILNSNASAYIYMGITIFLSGVLLIIASYTKRRDKSTIYFRKAN